MKIEYSDIVLLNTELKRQNIRYHVRYKNEDAACIEPPGECCRTKVSEQAALQCIEEYYRKKNISVRFTDDRLYFSLAEMYYIMNTPYLETSRLILRRFTESDIDALFDLLGDEEVNIFLPWFPTRTRDEAVNFYEERFARNYRKPSGYNYAVCLKTDNIPIGYVNLNMSDSYDLGYGLARRFWHQGIMSEACRAVVGQLKKDGIPYITATHDVKNPRSGGVMRQLGMKYRYSYEELVQPKNVLVTFRMYQLNLDGDQERVYRKYWDESEVHFVERSPL